MRQSEGREGGERRSRPQAEKVLVETREKDRWVGWICQAYSLITLQPTLSNIGTYTNPSTPRFPLPPSRAVAAAVPVATAVLEWPAFRLPIINKLY